MLVFSIFDTKSQSYGPLVAYATDGEACRAIAMALQDKTSALSQFPQDFVLSQVATWDPRTGVVEPVALRTVCSISALLE